MFIRKWENKPCLWTFGRLPNGGVYYLKHNTKAHHTLKQHGCSEVGQPTKPVTEQQLIHKFVANDWAVCGRLLDHEEKSHE